MLSKDILNEYQRWCSLVKEDQDLIQELKAIKDDESKIEDAFYTPLNRCPCRPL